MTPIFDLAPQILRACRPQSSGGLIILDDLLASESFLIVIEHYYVRWALVRFYSKILIIPFSSAVPTSLIYQQIFSL